MLTKTKDGVPLGDPGEATLYEILTHKFKDIKEDSDYYYLYEESDDPYNESWWVIDKKSKKLYWAYFLDLALNDVFDKATTVNPETLRRVF